MRGSITIHAPAIKEAGKEISSKLAPTNDANIHESREHLIVPEPPSATPAAAPRHRGRWWRRSLIFLALSGLLIAFFAQWIDYRISHVVARQAVVKGVVSQVGARIAGRIAEVCVMPNQRVHKGDVLARLDDEHLKAALESNLAALSRAKSEFNVALKDLQFDRERLALEVNLKSARVRAATADMVDAKAQARRWTRERERIDKLTIPQTVTASTKDEVIALEEGKAAALAAAGERLEEAKFDQRLAEKAIEQLVVAEARLEVLRKDIDLAQANVKTAEADLAATVIRAPEDGWVARQLVEAGGSVRIGDQIVALWTGDQLWVEAWVDESDLANVKVGSSVEVYFAAYPDRVLPGRVEAIGVLSDGEFTAAASLAPAPTSNSLLSTPTNIAARIAVLSPDIQLMPGLTAMVGIQSGYRNPARQWIPASVATFFSSVRDSLNHLWARLDHS